MSHAPNVAHVHGVSGTIIVPAHSPYDRQMLREHIENRVSRVSTLTLGMHGIRWTITRRTPANLRCTTCGQFLGRVSCSREDDVAQTCLDCAMRPGRNERKERPNS